jgi:SAM-dependent methyltransferase
MPRSLHDIAASFDTDKTESNTYIENFERHFGPLRQEPVKMLELGVFRGGSMLTWHEYFPQGLIVGLDMLPNPIANMPDRMRFYQGSQVDMQLLDRIAAECAPEGFDIVLDDASHLGKLTRASYRNLFHKHLKPGGIYVVEDWGTGYWANWPDGSLYRPAIELLTRAPAWNPSLRWRIARKLGLVGRKQPQHLDSDPSFSVNNFGMVGFIKELVDEIAWPDITSPGRGDPGQGMRGSTIREMALYCGHAFVVKA